MMSRWAGVVAVQLLTLVALAPAASQWSVQTSTDDFTDETTLLAVGDGVNGELRVAVTCYGDSSEGYTVAVQLLRDGRFLAVPDTSTRRRLGLVEARWDNGEVERTAFRHIGELLVVTDASERGGWWDNHIGLTDRLRQHNDLRLRVTRWPDTRVTDRVSLAGSTRAIEQLPCSR